MSQAVSPPDRFAGCLLGLAVGDALGSHFEGLPYDWIGSRYASSTELARNLPAAPWYYTDDTEMAIGLAEALTNDREVVEESLCRAFAENYHANRGYGAGARRILEAIRAGQDYKYWTHNLFPGGSFGNGAAMRVAPVGLMFHHDPDRLWQQAELSALPTHIHPLGIEGAQLLALAVSLALSAASIDQSRFLADLQGRAQTDEFRRKLKLAEQVSSHRELLTLGNGIAAHDSVVTAIACFLLWPDSYEQVVTHAILLGGDTDTIAAMAGAVAGAHLGIGAIPQQFLRRLEDSQKGRNYLLDLSSRLFSASM